MSAGGRERGAVVASGVYRAVAPQGAARTGRWKIEDGRWGEEGERETGGGGMKLTDVSPMPFGKYRGKPMEDVPASYLHWLWNDGLNENSGDGVHQYIVESMAALEIEVPNAIWKKPAPGKSPTTDGRR